MNCFALPPTCDATLHYGYARAAVTLEQPVAAVLHLGAQQFALLWVNGISVGRTYVRHHDDEWRYERFDLAPCLRPGENVIAVLLHAWGAPEADIPGVSPPKPIRFAVAGQVGVVDLADPTVWRVAPATEYRPARRHNDLIGHEERRDFRLEAQGWKVLGFDDGGWQRPRVEEMPDVAFRPSPLRPLHEEPVVPTRLIAQGRHVEAVARQACAPRFDTSYWRIAFTLTAPTELTFYYRHRVGSRLWVDGVERPFSFEPPFPWVEQYRPVALALGAGEHVLLGQTPAPVEFQQQGQPFGWAECPPGGDRVAWGASPDGPFMDGETTPDLDNRPLIDQISPTTAGILAADGRLDLVVEDAEVAVLLEFARSMTLLPVVEVSDATAGVELELVYSERLSQVAGLTFPAAYTDRAILRDGAQTWEVSCQYKSARMLKLIVRARGGRAVIRRVSAIYRHYAYDPTGQFTCDDERLNAIWQICRNTMEFGSQDVIMDGPWREQLLYIGDNYVHNQACYHLFGNHEIVEWQHTLYAQGQMPDGLFQPNQPCRTPPEDYRLLDQTILWPIQLEHHWRYTGRRKCIGALLPQVVRLMDGFIALFARSGDPRLRNVTGWNWVDHPGWEDGRVRGIRHEGIPTAINLLQVLALQSSARLLRDAGMASEAARLEARAGALAARLRQAHWDGTRQVFADCVVKGKPSSEVSVHVNLLAMLAGLADDPAGLLDRTWKRPGVLQLCGAFFRVHLFEVLHRLGRVPELLAEMRAVWGDFLDAGLTSTPEYHQVNGEWGASVGHPWGASPAIYLVRSVAGLTPAAPGWARVAVAPNLCDLRQVRVAVPTPQGQIAADFCQTENGVTGVIRAPHGVEFAYSDPLLGRRIRIERAL
jgi:hypothetical protein